MEKYKKGAAIGGDVYGNYEGRLPKNKKYFCCLPSNNWHGMVQERKDIFPTSKIMFEGVEFSAPHDTDAYLKKLYRNYMQMPPEDKRDIHSVFIMPDLDNE